MKGRMSTKFWAGGNNATISRVAQTYLKPSKQSKTVKMSVATAGGCSSCHCSCNGCTACEGSSCSGDSD